MASTAVCPKCNQPTTVRGDISLSYGVHFANTTDARPCEMSFKPIQAAIVEPIVDLHHSQGVEVAAVILDATKEKKMDIKQIHLQPIEDGVNKLATDILTKTNRHGLKAITVSAELGINMGVPPGTSFNMATPCGYILVHVEKSS